MKRRGQPVVNVVIGAEYLKKKKKTALKDAAIKRICPSHLHIIITRTTISKEKIREIPRVL